MVLFRVKDMENGIDVNHMASIHQDNDKRDKPQEILLKWNRIGKVYLLNYARCVQLKQNVVTQIFIMLTMASSYSRTLPVACIILNR